MMYMVLEKSVWKSDGKNLSLRGTTGERNEFFPSNWSRLMTCQFDNGQAVMGKHTTYT